MERASALAVDSHLSRGLLATRRASLAVSFPTVAIAGTGESRWKYRTYKHLSRRRPLSEHAFRSGAASLA